MAIYRKQQAKADTLNTLKTQITSQSLYVLTALVWLYAVRWYCLHYNVVSGTAFAGIDSLCFVDNSISCCSIRFIRV